jgi:hypothetical protein
MVIGWWLRPAIDFKTNSLKTTTGPADRSRERTITMGEFSGAVFSFIAPSGCDPGAEPLANAPISPRQGGCYQPHRNSIRHPSLGLHNRRAPV